MNIALFASSFYPHIGGVEEHVRQLACVLRECGISVIIITNHWPPTLPYQEEYEGTPVYRLSLRLPEGNVKARIRYALTQPHTQRELLVILRRHSIDLIHVHCVSVNGHYALLAKQALYLPLVVTAHGERTMDASGLYERSPFTNQILRDLLRDADAITACSRDTLTDIETFYGQPFGNRGQVIYNGIRMDDFTDANPYVHARPYILGIGRLVPQKGFDILIRAFAQAALPNTDLLLAGEGIERAALEALSKSLGVEERIRFMGRADRTMAVSLFKGCNFFVLPSRQEPFGIVNLEAMAAGKAIIASRVGGVPEIVEEGYNGLLVPSEDVNALAQALTRLSTDVALREQLGKAGNHRAPLFAWPVIADQYLSVYRVLHQKC